MDSFITINQFDQKYRALGTFGADCNACPLFALLTAHYFLENGDCSKEQHEMNLDLSVNNTLNNSNLPKYVSFDELVQMTNGVYNDHDVMATMPMIIQEVGYVDIFNSDDYSKNYAVVFLKGGNYIVVLAKKTETGFTYHVRDCHDTVQYNVGSLNQLTEHLKTYYQFEELTVVDGVLIEEFANIEYLKMATPFIIEALEIPIDGQEEYEEITSDDIDDDSIFIDKADNNYNHDSILSKLDENNIDEDEALALALELSMYDN